MWKIRGHRPPSNKGIPMSEKQKEILSQKRVAHFDRIGRKIHRSYKHVGIEYTLWRKAVFERDEYLCRGCGQKGGKLVAHHILSWTDFPHKRFDITNGLTLCVKCHKETENYGNKKRGES